MTDATYYRCQLLCEVPAVELKADRAARWNELSDYLLSQVILRLPGHL